MRLIRANAGFQKDGWISLLEEKGLRYNVAAAISTLRHRLFQCAGIISCCQNQTILMAVDYLRPE